MFTLNEYALRDNTWLFNANSFRNEYTKSIVAAVSCLTLQIELTFLVVGFILKIKIYVTPAWSSWLNILLKMPRRTCMRSTVLLQERFLLLLTLPQTHFRGFISSRKIVQHREYWNTASLNHKVIPSLKIALILLQLVLSF